MSEIDSIEIVSSSNISSVSPGEVSPSAPETSIISSPINEVRTFSPEEFSNLTPPPEWRSRAESMSSDERWNNASSFAQEQQNIYESDLQHITFVNSQRLRESTGAEAALLAENIPAGRLAAELSTFAAHSLEANPFRADKLKLPQDITTLNGKIEEISKKIYRKLHPSEDDVSADKALSEVSAKHVLQYFSAESVLRYLNDLDEQELENLDDVETITVDPVEENQESNHTSEEDVSEADLVEELANEDLSDLNSDTETDPQSVLKRKKKQTLISNLLYRYGLDFYNPETRQQFFAVFNYVNEVLDFVDIQNVIDAFFDTHTSHGMIASGNLEWFSGEKENSDQESLFKDILNNPEAVQVFLKHLFEEEDLSQISPEQQMDKLDMFAQSFKPSNAEDIKNSAREQWRKAFIEGLGILHKAPPSSLDTYTTVSVSGQMIEGLAEKVKARK